MAFSSSVFKVISLKVFNRSTWCIRRTLQSSAFLMKKKNMVRENLTSIVVSNPKWKQVEAIPAWKNITVQELADNLNRDVKHVLEVMTFIDDTCKYNRPNDIIDNFKVVQEVVKKSGKRVKLIGKPKNSVQNEKDEFIDVTRRKPEDYVDVRKRNPIVTIMGHVDHGKTTLLDTLRKSAIVESEFGGITQHIGAFNVPLGKERVTFLDTPGHAAFCSMRNRGAQCTDIVVLVVAADDGVMEQTVESINMAKAAGVPIVVAINKIDKPSSNVENTKQMLVPYGLQAEDKGGDIQMVPISALEGTNVKYLIESILAQAELLELKADFQGPVEGVIIESTTDPHRGKLSTLLVQCGTLKKGCIMVAGTAWCRVRAMFDDRGHPLQQAGPSTPVQVLGWRILPFAGDVTIEVPNEKRAVDIIRHREQMNVLKNLDKVKEAIEKKTMEHEKVYRAHLEEKRRLGRYKLRPTGPRKKEYTEEYTGPRLNIIIKGDVNGSVEAILDVLETYESSQCQLDVVHYGVGPVSQNDIVLADTFNAVIYAFNVGAIKFVNKSSIKFFNVIYKLIDDLKSEINKLLPYKDVEEVVGEANVLQQFLINEGKLKVPVAGCRCVKGTIKKSGKFRLIRSNQPIFTGSAISLRHVKDEVNLIKNGLECGIRLSDPEITYQPGDTIVCFFVRKEPQTVNWNPGF